MHHQQVCSSYNREVLLTPLKDGILCRIKHLTMIKGIEMPDSAPRMESHPAQIQMEKNGLRAALLRYPSGIKRV